MKILITGGTGGIGTFLKEYYLNHQVFTMDKSCLDVCDRVHIMDIIRSLQPSIVLHCAAITDINFCEQDECSAYRVNTTGTLNVASACSSFDIPLAYISSNQVFDGYSKRPYLEYDHCNPLNNFGRTKLAGESLIRTLCEKYYNIRTCWVFGHRKCIVENALSQPNHFTLSQYNETANLTYIYDLCNVIEKIISSNQYGIFNCTNSGIVSRESWIRKACSLLNIPFEDSSVKLPTQDLEASVPSFAPLNCSLLYDAFKIKLPTWEDRLIEYLRR